MCANGRVLFIIHDVYQEDNHFPLGVGYMAAVLRREGADVKIYCQDIFHYTNEELAKFLQKNEFDLIGVGFLSARFQETILGLCDTTNKYKKNAWLVLGGPGPTPIPEYMLKKTNTDIVTMGEAEETFIELLKCKVDNVNLSKIKGIAYRNDGNIIINERRKPIRDLDSIPFPEWSLFPMEKYTTCLNLYRMTSGDRVFGILSSRGCINRCNFCYRMEKGIRFRSVENVIDEMKILKERYGVNYFLLYDEMFIFSKKRLYEFRDALEEHDLKIKISCGARVDIFDRELAKCLKECGCQFIGFGMESTDQKVLELMNKNATVEQNIRAAEISREMEIGIALNFLWGNKGDSEESLKNNVKFIKRYNTYDQLRTIRPVTPYPGSDLYYEAIDGSLLSGPEDFFDKFKNSDLLTVNFTDIQNGRFYKLLFEANKELIIDHYVHTTKDMNMANKLINDFYNLYFRNKILFRGSRHYENK
jgi:radical SAM superfamily enzyme YgiQ (UPF0313 family)